MQDKNLSRYDIEYTESYSYSIKILDHLLEYNIDMTKEYHSISKKLTWKEEKIRILALQGNEVIMCILKSSNESKFLKPPVLDNSITFGALGRIISDIYKKIIYLKYCNYPEDQIRLCWDYQFKCSRLKVIEFMVDESFDEERKMYINEVEEDKTKIKALNFISKSQVMRGKYEMMLTNDEIAELKGFDKRRFDADFIYMSQFAHASAFAGEISEMHSGAGKLAPMFDKIVGFYTCLTYEAISILHEQAELLDSLKILYEKNLKERWTI